MISPESLKWSISGNARTSGATTGSPRGISLTKLPNHACIMRFAEQKDTANGKSRTPGRQGDPLLQQSTYRERTVEYFLRWLNFYPRVMIAWWQNFNELNAISVSSNYIYRNWLNNNKQRNFMLDVICCQKSIALIENNNQSLNTYLIQSRS